MAIRSFSDPVRDLSIGRHPIQVLLIRSDLVRGLSIPSDPVLVLQTPDVKSQQQGILTDIVHGCSGVTYPYLMKQDEKSLRLPFYLQFVMICGFSVLRIFPTGNEGKCWIAQHSMQVDQSVLLSRFITRFLYQYGVPGCKLQMRTARQNGFQCWEEEFLAHCKT